MLRTEEVERLSRLVAGELSPREEAELRADIRRNPELATALARLGELDALLAKTAAREAGEPPSPVSMARAVRHKRRTWNWTVAACAALMVCGASYAMYRAGGPVTGPPALQIPALHALAPASPVSMPPARSSAATADPGPPSGAGAGAGCDPLDPGVEFEAVTRAIGSVAPQLAQCYEQGLAQYPGLSEKFTVLMHLKTVDGQGRLVECRVDSADPLPNAFVPGCLLEVLSRVLFPAPRNGETKISYPLEFSLRGDPRSGHPGAFLRLGAPGHSDARIGPPSEQKDGTHVDVKDAPARGSESSRVTVVEFTDPQCPFCSRGHAVMNDLFREYGDRVRFVVMLRPLPMHPHAYVASQAALAAGAQGKFWEYLDLMMAHQDQLDRRALEDHAAALRLDVPRFIADLDNGAFVQTLAKQDQEGERVGARGTPSYFINGRPLIGAQPFELYKAVIEQELAKARLSAPGSKNAEETWFKRGTEPKEAEPEKEKGTIAPSEFFNQNN